MADIRIPDGKLDYQRKPRLGEGPGGEAILKKNQPVRDLVIDEQGSAIVKEIFHKIVSDGWGTNRIANWLSDRGIATKNGKSYWRATSIRAIVRNPIYTGRIRFGRDLSEQFEHLRLIDDYIFQDCDRLVK